MKVIPFSKIKTLLTANIKVIPLSKIKTLLPANISEYIIP
jgi:hypothetical protein